MLSDPIADMLTRIRNGYLVAKKEIAMPYSKVKEQIARVLTANNYLSGFKKNGKEKKSLICQLKYNKNQPAISELKRISKPSLRVYLTKKKLVRMLRRRGKIIISTSQGIMTDKEARKKSLGGEIIARVY